MGTRRKEKAARPRSLFLLGAAQEMSGTTVTPGEERDEQTDFGGIKDGSTENVNGGWRSPGPGPD